LPQKLLAVRKRVKAFIEKDKIHEIRKDGKKVGEFNYVSHDMVTAHVRDAFNEFGVLTWPSVIAHATNGNRTELQVVTAFINADSPEDQMSITTYGYGVDFSDKGPGKALSYAVKYAYLKALMLQSADDVEADDIKHDPVDPRASDVERAAQKVKDDIQASANELKLAIRGTESVKDLVKLQRERKDWLMDIPEVTRDYFIGEFEKRKGELEAA